MTGFLFLVANLAVSIGTIIHAYRRHPDKFILACLLCSLGGIVGSLIVFMLIHAPKAERPVSGEAGVESCPHCGTAYRSSDYRAEAAIICPDCRQPIRNALAPLSPGV